jgi:hypothetical protein
MTLTDLDRDALTRALVACRSESAARSRQLDAKLQAEPWERVARFAAYSVQIDALRLEPWETPPVRIRDIDAALSAPDDARRVRDAARLLQRMLALNISRYEPDPLRAIAEAEAKHPETKKGATGKHRPKSKVSHDETSEPADAFIDDTAKATHARALR